MAVAYVVTYDLNKETARPDILTEIKKSDGYAKLSESSYAVSTDETPDQLYKRLEKYLDDNDQLYIISLSRPYSGSGPVDVNSWLDQHIPS
ncbi:hypothetical protein [Shinella sp.]|uniref:hypothetical protein n=1 Tax=Shinella sp. TaxID=1870904 RepID=UPI00403510B9